MESRVGKLAWGFVLELNAKTNPIPDRNLRPIPPRPELKEGASRPTLALDGD
jgi:hypothetical protein